MTQPLKEARWSLLYVTLFQAVFFELAHDTKIFIKSLLFTTKSWNLVQLIFEL